MRAHRSKRLGMHFGAFIWLIPCVILAGFILWFTLIRTPPSFRRTVVFAGSPVVVWSCASDGSGCDVVTIPSSYVVDAVHGYGRYTLEALWRLGFIDKRGGGILAESVADLLGLSRAWYFGPPDSSLPVVDNGVTLGRKTISLGALFPFMFHRDRSDIPTGEFIALAKQISSARYDQITAIDLSQKPVTESQTLPDGTTQNVVSPDQIDRAMKGIFEDTAVRQEALTVAVDNTTQTPDLGTRAARLLSAGGVLVVSVGNDEPERTSCTVSGSRQTLASHTARVIESILDCRGEENTKQQSSDLVVRVGTDFAARYAP